MTDRKPGIYKITQRPTYQALIKLKGGNIPTGTEQLFERVYWKSPLFASIGLKFWRRVLKECRSGASPCEGLPVNFHREWRKEHGLSVGAYYRMTRALVGCGMIDFSY